MTEPPVLIEQKSVLAEYRKLYRQRVAIDSKPNAELIITDIDTIAALDHQLSWLRSQMTPPTLLAASQYERAWRRAA